MNIRQYTFEEFLERAREFHGYPAPGIAVGGFMVDLAYRHLPKEGLFKALCETPKCLPDAIQLLTPCTTGNGRLTVINVGRYALALYDKESGEGVRVFVDAAKLEALPELKSWFFKLKPKNEQDSDLLIAQIGEGGSSICGVQKVMVADRFLTRRRRSGIALCPKCHESYPVDDGAVCLVCSGNENLYR
jgi:formylmethanofuran dehydrogenase subunit E